MRKQYHFRKSKDGLLAWDVDRLVALTSNLTPEPVPLKQIGELDEAYWYGAEGDQPSCRSIAEHMKLTLEAELAYPIILCPAGRVMDGMHRIVKALVMGHASINAYRLPMLPPPDYVDVDPAELPY